MNGPKSMLNKANSDSTIGKESVSVGPATPGFYGYSTVLDGVIEVLSCFCYIFVGSFIIKNYSYETHR